MRPSSRSCSLWKCRGVQQSAAGPVSAWRTAFGSPTAIRAGSQYLRCSGLRGRTTAGAVAFTPTTTRNCTTTTTSRVRDTAGRPTAQKTIAASVEAATAHRAGRRLTSTGEEDSRSPRRRTPPSPTPAAAHRPSPRCLSEPRAPRPVDHAADGLVSPGQHQRWTIPCVRTGWSTVQLLGTRYRDLGGLSPPDQPG